MSPVNAPEASAWQSCAPIATFEPWLAEANIMTKVAGGQTSRSTCGKSVAPCTILPSSAAAGFSPFIFQLPATSGRRAAVINSPRYVLVARYQTRVAVASSDQVATQGRHPYDARPCGNRLLAGRHPLMNQRTFMLRGMGQASANW